MCPKWKKKKKIINSSFLFFPLNICTMGCGGQLLNWFTTFILTQELAQEIYWNQTTLRKNLLSQHWCIRMIKNKPQTSNCGLELIKFDSFISSLGKKVWNSRKKECGCIGSRDACKFLSSVTQCYYTSADRLPFQKHVWRMAQQQRTVLDRWRSSCCCRRTCKCDRHTRTQSRGGKLIFGHIYIYIAVKLLTERLIGEQIHKQTSDLDFADLRAVLPWLYHLFSSLFFFFYFFPNKFKLSIVPAALSICIQRDIFTQWDTGTYKQWQTLSWIKHSASLLWECLSCQSCSPLGFLPFQFFFWKNLI